MGFSKGTRAADSVLREGEGAYYGEGFDRGFIKEVSVKRPDNSQILLSGRVWERSADPAAVEECRRDAREKCGGAVLSEVAEKEETPDQRFNRLAGLLVRRIVREVISSCPKKEDFTAWLKGSSTNSVVFDYPIEDITRGLDVSVYRYNLTNVNRGGCFSEWSPVERIQFYNMWQRREWIEKLEEAIAKRVLAALKEKFKPGTVQEVRPTIEIDGGELIRGTQVVTIADNFDNLKLNVSFDTSEGKCVLKAWGWENLGRIDC